MIKKPSIFKVSRYLDSTIYGNPAELVEKDKKIELKITAQEEVSSLNNKLESTITDYITEKTLAKCINTYMQRVNERIAGVFPKKIFIESVKTTKRYLPARKVDYQIEIKSHVYLTST